eukprot:1739235-Amphidinium_carterae.1
MMRSGVNHHGTPSGKRLSKGLIQNLLTIMSSAISMLKWYTCQSFRMVGAILVGFSCSDHMEKSG